MKKLLGIVVLSLSLVLLNSCQSGGVTGKMSYGLEESPLWFMTATKEDIKYYYDSQSTSRLCIKWQERYPGVKLSETIRGKISDALERRGENGLKCYDTAFDNTMIQNAELRRAQAAAAQARADAERARIAQQQAEQEAYNTRKEANWRRINCPSGTGTGYSCN